jgi:hypothetical protein
MPDLPKDFNLSILKKKISTCLWTRPRLTRMNRGALLQNGGSKRRAFSESDGKPWFKEAFYEI